MDMKLWYDSTNNEEELYGYYGRNLVSIGVWGRLLVLEYKNCRKLGYFYFLR